MGFIMLDCVYTLFSGVCLFNAPSWPLFSRVCHFFTPFLAHFFRCLPFFHAPSCPLFSGVCLFFTPFPPFFSRVCLFFHALSHESEQFQIRCKTTLDICGMRLVSNIHLASRPFTITNKGYMYSWQYYKFSHISALCFAKVFGT